MDLVLFYVSPEGYVCDTGIKVKDAHDTAWVHHMVSRNPDTNFFFVTYSTDVEV